MKCAHCKINYPDSVGLSPVLGNHPTKSICGICALEYINLMHGVQINKFQGEMAEQNRQDAIKYRKKINWKPK